MSRRGEPKKKNKGASALCGEASGLREVDAQRAVESIAAVPVGAQDRGRVGARRVERGGVIGAPQALRRIVEVVSALATKRAVRPNGGRRIFRSTAAEFYKNRLID